MLVAGAGTAAALTMMTAMAQSDQVVEPVEVIVFDSPVFDTAGGLSGFTPVSPAVTDAPEAGSQAVQTISVARPVRAQVSNARTSASR